jgi:hypothetical protein
MITRARLERTAPMRREIRQYEQLFFDWIERRENRRLTWKLLVFVAGVQFLISMPLGR